MVDAQLDSTALLILQQAVGPKELPHIQKFDTAKETWDAIEARFIGNDSMRRNRFEELCNEAEGFYMLDGESHRSEEHTSELQSPLIISYAVFCLKKIFLMIRRPPRSTL